VNSAYRLRLVSSVPPARVSGIAESVAVATNTDTAALRDAISQPPGSLVITSGSLELVIEVKIALRLEGIITEVEQIPTVGAASGRPERHAAPSSHPMPPHTDSSEIDGGGYRAPTTSFGHAQTDGLPATPNTGVSGPVSLAEGTTGRPNLRRPQASPDAGPQALRGSRTRTHRFVLATALLTTAVLVFGGLWKGGWLDLSPTHGPGTVDRPRQASTAFIEEALGDCTVLDMWRYESGQRLAGVLTRCQQPDGVQRFRLDYDLGFRYERTVVATEDISPGIRYKSAGVLYNLVSSPAWSGLSSPCSQWALRGYGS
jgi:hypothetical protein